MCVEVSLRGVSPPRRAIGGSTTGRLLILKEGAVAVVKEGVEIARVTELQADCLAGVWAHHSQQKWKGGQT